MLRSLAFTIISLAVAAPAISAQATTDQSRLVVGVMGGWIGGKDLWSVASQPVFAIGNQFDEFAIDRRLRSNVTFSGQATFFPSDNLGWTAEVTYLGLGTADRCEMVTSSGDFINEAACAAIDGMERSASAVALMGGVVLRPWSRGLIQPYFRAVVGMALVPRSTTAVTATFGQFGESALPLYEEDGSRAAKPTGALSLGFATEPGSGYQFRVEGRLSATQLRVVTGPTATNAGASLVPPSKSEWVVMPSIMVGIDIVLEKRRGRRY